MSLDTLQKAIRDTIVAVLLEDEEVQTKLQSVLDVESIIGDEVSSSMDSFMEKHGDRFSQEISGDITDRVIDAVFDDNRFRTKLRAEIHTIVGEEMSGFDLPAIQAGMRDQSQEISALKAQVEALRNQLAER